MTAPPPVPRRIIGSGPGAGSSRWADPRTRAASVARDQPARIWPSATVASSQRVARAMRSTAGARTTGGSATWCGFGAPGGLRIDLDDDLGHPGDGRAHGILDPAGQ